MVNTQTPAGWYPDPAGDITIIRYWDGEKWTDQTQAAQNPELRAFGDAAANAAGRKARQTPETFGAAPPSNPMPGASPYIAPQPIYAQGQLGAGMPGEKPKDPSRDKFAIISMILGISATLICCVVGMIKFFYVVAVVAVVAIVFAVLGFRSTKRGMAITGLVLGIVMLTFFALTMFSLLFMASVLGIEFADLVNMDSEQLYQELVNYIEKTSAG